MDPPQPTPVRGTEPPSQPAPPSPPAPPPPPAQPPRPSSAPGSVFYPPPQPKAPPPTPTTGIRVLDEDENEVEQTITPRRIAVPTAPSAGPSELRRSGRTTHIPGQYRHLAGEDADNAEQLEFVFCAEYDNLIAEAIDDMSSDPTSLTEAQSRSNWPQWKGAMDREMVTLERAGTWQTVQRPHNKNVIGSKWVFHIKCKADGSVDKYKAHLVARGFTQIYGVDYFDTYSPVAKLSSIRLILAIAARYDWDIDSFDFGGAYIRGELDNKGEIYMQSPPGYSSDADSVKRLKKSLYGLKQAGRKWYDTLVRALKKLGFRTTYADPGVFYACIEEHILILAVYVDDCIFTGSSNKFIALYKQKLNSFYALTDLGPLHGLLGITITRDRAAHTISLSQSAYLNSILSCFSFTDAKPYGSPMTPGDDYSKKDAPATANEAARMKRTPYRQAIGSLMYVAIATRPHITFAVSSLSRFLNNPGDTHWEAVNR